MHVHRKLDPPHAPQLSLRSAQTQVSSANVHAAFALQPSSVFGAAPGQMDGCAHHVGGVDRVHSFAVLPNTFRQAAITRHCARGSAPYSQSSVGAEQGVRATGGEDGQGRGRAASVAASAVTVDASGPPSRSVTTEAAPLPQATSESHDASATPKEERRGFMARR